METSHTWNSHEVIACHWKSINRYELLLILNAKCFSPTYLLLSQNQQFTLLLPIISCQVVSFIVIRNPETLSMLSYLWMDNHKFQSFETNLHLTRLVERAELADYELMFHTYIQKVIFVTVICLAWTNAVSFRKITKSCTTKYILSHTSNITVLVLINAK